MNKTGKDRGWSWVVLACVGIAQALSMSQLLSFGIFYVFLLDEFGCAQQEAAFVGALSFAVFSVVSAPASVFQRKYGSRLVVMVGGLLTGLGYLLSYFATAIWHLYLTYGVLVGLGVGFTYVPSVGVITDYFEKYRYFATAFAPVVSAASRLVFSPFYFYLIESYTWKGAMVILSGLSLQIVLCGAVMRSRTKQQNVTWTSSMERVLFSNGKFILILLEALFFAGAMFTVFAMANSLAIKKGFTKAESTYIVAVVGFCDLAGRLTSSMASMSSRMDPPLSYALSTLVCGVGAVSSIACDTLWTLALSLGLFGFAFGIKVSQMSPVMIDLFGVNKFINAMGYMSLIGGMGGVLSPSLAGLLAEKTSGGVENSFWLAGSLLVVSAALLFIVSAWNFRSKKKTKALTTAARQDANNLRMDVPYRTVSSSNTDDQNMKLNLDTGKER